MKKKKSTALFLALLMIASVFLNGTSVFAENEQEVPGVNQAVEKVQEVKLEDKKDDQEEVKAEGEEKDSEKIEVKEESKKDDGLEISKEVISEPVGEPATKKTFTVTKDLLEVQEMENLLVIMILFMKQWAIVNKKI